MRWIDALRARLHLLSRRAAEERMEEEMRFHLEREKEKHVSAGLSPEEARRRAAVAFGGREGHKEEMREGRPFAWLGGLSLDLKLAVRHFRSFAVAVVSLGLGLGATTAVYSNVDWLLRRPPGGVEDPDRLVTLLQAHRNLPESTRSGLNRDQYDVLKEVQDAFSDMAVYSKVSGLVSTEFVTEEVVFEYVEGSYSRVLGLRPALGRLITPEDDFPGVPNVAVLTHRYWTSRFGADPGILGRRILLNGQAVEVVGVLPAEFEGYSLDWNGPTSILLPLKAGLFMGDQSFTGYIPALRVIGRLRPDVPLEAVHDRSDMWFRQLPPAFQPNQALGPMYLVVRAGDEMRISANDTAARQFLGGLLVVCSLVLLASLFNLANVFLGRSLVRGREMAIRGAIGANRGRLIRQLLTESLLIGAAVGVLAVSFGWVVARVLAPLPAHYLRLRLAVTPLTTVGAFDIRLAALALLAGILAVGVFGVLPSLPHFLRPPSTVLGSSRPTWSWSRWRLSGRQFVLVLQIGMSVTLGVLAGLYARSFARLASVPSEYKDPGSVLVARVVPSDKFAGRVLHRELQARLAADPGVVSASISLDAPFMDGGNVYALPGDPSRQVEASSTTIGPQFFETLGVPLVAGREFDAATADLDGIVVNQTLAATLWPDANPIGQTVLYGRTNPTELRVLGVAAVEHCWDPLGDPQPCAWRAFTGTGLGYLRIRTVGDPMAFARTLRQIVRSIDPEAAIAAPETFRTSIERLTAAEQAAATASSALAIFALLLVGLSSASLFLSMVRASVREIAIRMAIGAGANRVVGRIVGHGVVLLGIGTAAGLLIARPLSTRIADQLYQVGAGDLATYAGASWIVFVVGVLSVGYAALVAARTEPIEHLKQV